MEAHLDFCKDDGHPLSGYICRLTHFSRPSCADPPELKSPESDQVNGGMGRQYNGVSKGCQSRGKVRKEEGNSGPQFQGDAP